MQALADEKVEFAKRDEHFAKIKGKNIAARSIKKCAEEVKMCGFVKNQRKLFQISKKIMRKTVAKSCVISYN